MPLIILLPLELSKLLPPRLPQVPPNLIRSRPDVLIACLEEGARDLGGISPRDEVNPDFSFPSLSELNSLLALHGYHLAPRRAVHARLVSQVSPHVTGLVSIAAYS